MEKVIDAIVNGFLLFRGHPVMLFIFSAAVFASMYMILALKWPQILPTFNKDAKDEPENKDKSPEELIKLDWKAKKALRDQKWKETISEAIDAILKDNRVALQTLVKDISSRMEALGEKVDLIETKLESLFAIIAEHEELFGPLSQETLEDRLFNESLPIFRRLKAFYELLAKGVNGRVKQKGFQLILQNKKTIVNDDGTKIKIDPWLDVLETIQKAKVKIVNEKHFEAVLDEINANLYAGMMR